MPYTIFAANKNKTGGALFVSFNSKDQSVYFSFFKQVDYDEENQKKNFDFKNPVNVKFNIAEAGGFIRAVRTNSTYKFYHTFNNDKTSGSLGYYELENEKDPKNKRVGFGIKIDKNGEVRKVNLGIDNAEALSEYLKFALDHIFSSIYADDKKKAEEFANKKQNAAPAQTPKTVKDEYLPEDEPAKEDAPNDDDVDF